MLYIVLWNTIFVFFFVFLREGSVLALSIKCLNATIQSQQPYTVHEDAEKITHILEHKGEDLNATFYWRQRVR